MELKQTCASEEVDLERMTQLFKTLGDPSRVRILFQIFTSEACINEIARKLNMSEPAVSHHMRILKMNGLVRWHRSGKNILYELDDEHVRSIISQGMEHTKELQHKSKT